MTLFITGKIDEIITVDFLISKTRYLFMFLIVSNDLKENKIEILRSRKDFIVDSF
jgi:hypothetical protein